MIEELIDTVRKDVHSRLEEQDIKIRQIATKIENVDKAIGQIATKIENVDKAVRQNATNIENVDKAVRQNATNIEELCEMVERNALKIKDLRKTTTGGESQTMGDEYRYNAPVATVRAATSVQTASRNLPSRRARGST